MKPYKKFYFTCLTLIFLFGAVQVNAGFFGDFFNQLFPSQQQFGATICYPHQGCTGKGSATAGDVGKYLKVSANSPFTYSFDTPAGGGTGTVSTSTNETSGFLSYWTSNSATPALLGQVATTTLTATSPLALSTAISVIGSAASALTCTTAASGVAGCLSNTAFDTFNNKQDALTFPLTVTQGGSGWANIQTGSIPYGAGTTKFSTTTQGVGGQVLTWSGGIPTWIATTTYSAPLVFSGANVTCTAASSGVNGCLSGTNWDTFNNKQATISATWPITLTGATVGFNGLSTSTAAVTSNIPYFSGVNTFANVATTTLTGTAPIVFSNAISVIGGSASAISCTAASGSVAGCLSAADWTTFNNKVGTSSAETVGGLAYFTTNSATPALVSSLATSSANALLTISATTGYPAWSTTWAGNTSIATVGTLTAGALGAGFTAVNVAQGGTGATTLTGILKGNGTSAFTAATAGTDYVVPSVTTLSSLASIGTITTGVWNGTAITTSYGGTGLSTGGLASTFIPYGNGTSAFATSSVLYFSAGSLYSTTFVGALTGTASGNLTSASIDTYAELNAIVADVTLTHNGLIDTSAKLAGVLTDEVGTGKLAFSQYPAFTYSTSTAWTGTTTIPLGVAFIAETWDAVQCFTNVGTTTVEFYDGTNRMNLFFASTTVGIITLSTNNTFTASEKRYVDIGTPEGSPTKISCTIKKSY